MNKPLKVLFVEDSEDDAELLVMELERGGYELIYQRVDTPSAMREALENPRGWDIIFADYSMPNFSAIAALEILKAKGLDLPFIIISGTIEEEIAIAAMKAGVHDYLLKHQLGRLIPAVERELREAKIRHQNRQIQKKLEYLAFYDESSNLPNRTSFLNYIYQELQQKDKLFAVLLVNLDRFDTVKSSLGHRLSEQLLIATANRLEKCLQKEDVMARIGSSELAILLKNIPTTHHLQKIALSLQIAIASPFNLDGILIYSSIIIGMVISNIGFNNPEDLLQASDTAIHYAKKYSISKPVVFDMQMQTRAIDRLKLETELQQAIKNQELYLAYQPIISLQTGKLDGFEALVRWKHPVRGVIPPDRFIPLAEETGIIIPLGAWVLSQACRRLAKIQADFPQHLPLTMSINISGIQLSHAGLLSQIDKLLMDLNLDGSKLKLEITESVLMENPLAARKVVEELKKRQIQVCIDDFGTGYSSLSHLHRLPIDILKIDRCFIKETSSDWKNSKIIKSIVDLAHNLGLELIAEGVETLEQLQMLQELGCQYGQGYLFSKPLDASQVLDLLGKLRLNENLLKNKH